MILRVALLVLAFVVPLCGAAGILLTQQAAKIALTVRERDGLAFTTRTIDVVAALRALRDKMMVDGDAGEPERRSVALALDALYDYNSGEGRSLELTKRLKRLETQWLLVPDDVSGARQVEDALATAVSLFGITSDRSALSSDQDAATGALIDAYGTQLPTVGQRVDRAKLILVSALRTRRDILQNRIGAAVLIGGARHAFQIARTDVSNAARVLTEPATASATMSDVGLRLDAFIELVGRDRLTEPSARRTVRVATDAVLGAVRVANEQLAGEINRRLAQREAAEERALILLRAETGLAVFVALAMALLLSRTIRDHDRRELSRARDEADRLAAELDRQHRLEMLAVTEAHFRAAFERSAIGVAILDHEGKILRSNNALQDMLPSLDARHIGAGELDFERLLAGDIESFALDLEFHRDATVPMWLETTLSLVRDDIGTPLFAIAMVKDITERKRIDERLRYEASHDSLSRLPNRAHFVERVRGAFFAGSHPDGCNAVLFVDLDEFKFVNDSLGHAIGDRVIVAAGERLQAIVGPADCVARFGGDEFAILLASRVTRAQIERVVDRLGRALAEPIAVDGQEIYVTASIGVALVDRSYRAVEEILRDADTAMYHAKAHGRARSAIFDASMHDQAARRLEIATQLRRALEREQFHVVYQPIVSLASGELRSCEALLRWSHPDLGHVSPADFIPIAEEIGLIVPIGRYVLDRACRQFSEWKRTHPRTRPPRITVNASVREIVQTDYVDFVERAVAKYGLLPGELMLEVTETAILSGGKYSFSTLERIKDAGVGLAVDDFGTGYSSLRYLQQFPFDELKIDRSFVGGADGTLASEPIVSMVLTLAKTVGVGVVAEGVETPAQAARLRSLGCTSAQGYLYGKPASAGAFIDAFAPKAETVAS